MVVFFDIDETLINQRQAETAAVEQLLARCGDRLDRRYSVAEFCSMWRALREKHIPAFLSGQVSAGEQRRRRMRELFGLCGLRLGNREADHFVELYEACYRDSWKVFDDVVPALQALSHHRCGIISNGSVAQQKLKISKTGIADFFEVVVVSEDAGAAKPSGDIFLAACRRAGAAARRCCYVGDRLCEDALASRAVGMHAYWLCRENPGAHAGVEVVRSLIEIPWRIERRIAI